MRGARWGCRSAALAAFAVELLRADHLRRVLRFIVGCDFAADDLAVERKRLQHDVEAAPVVARPIFPPCILPLYAIEDQCPAFFFPTADRCLLTD